MRTPKASCFLRLMVLAAVLSACSQRPAATSEEAAHPAAAAAVPGSRAFIDPATGQLREPTAAELAELARQESAGKAPGAPSGKSAAPAEIHYPDGTVGIAFGGGSLAPLRACVNASGEIDEHCAESGSVPVERNGRRP